MKVIYKRDDYTVIEECKKVIIKNDAIYFKTFDDVVLEKYLEQDEKDQINRDIVRGEFYCNYVIQNTKKDYLLRLYSEWSEQLRTIMPDDSDLYGCLKLLWFHRLTELDNQYCLEKIYNAVFNKLKRDEVKVFDKILDDSVYGLLFKEKGAIHQ